MTMTLHHVTAIDMTEIDTEAIDSYERRGLVTRQVGKRLTLVYCHMPSFDTVR